MPTQRPSRFPRPTPGRVWMIVFAIIGILLASWMLFSPPPKASAQQLPPPATISTFEMGSQLVFRVSTWQTDPYGYIRKEIGTIMFAEQVDKVAFGNNRSGYELELVPFPDYPNMGTWTSVWLSIKADMPVGTKGTDRVPVVYYKDGVSHYVGDIIYSFELTDQPVGCPHSIKEAAAAIGGDEAWWSEVENPQEVYRAYELRAPDWIYNLLTPDWADDRGSISLLSEAGEFAGTVPFVSLERFMGKRVGISCYQP